MDDDLPESVKECLKILDDCVDFLSNLEHELEDEKEDEVATDLKLHHLYDMTEDVAESARIKRAESNLVRRKIGDSL